MSAANAPAVVDFLRSGGTLEELAARYFIKAARHKGRPNLILLKYDQINSPFAEPIVRECRGIILDEADEWRVVSRSFDKFFNHGESHAAAIDWSTACVQEKVDGSLMSVYWHDGEWQVATTGTPDASGPVGSGVLTFRDLFWQTFGAADLWLDPAAAGFTFLFELTAPENRVVVPHQSRSLTLLAGRHAETGAWLTPDVAASWFDGDVRTVREFPLQSIDQIVATFDRLSPLAQEGYVIVDGAFNRIKVKHPGYVAMHHAKDGVSPRSLLEIVRRGEAPEFLAHFPEIADEANRIRERFEALCAEVDADFDSLRHLPTQKDFALQATKRKQSGALFALRAGKVANAREFLAGAHIDHVMRAVGLKEAA